MIKNEELKTSWKTRLAVGLVGVGLLVSTLAIYLAIFVQYEDQGSDAVAATTELENRYSELYATTSGYGKAWSAQYYETFSGYRAEVKGYNEEALVYGVRDLKVGDGRMIDAASDPYLAYYVGWRPDETIIDSSFDNYETPTALKLPLAGTTKMIRGWLEGIVGMRIGGVREISIPSDYAYGSGALKFVVMLIPYEEQELADIQKLGEVAEMLNNLQ